MDNFLYGYIPLLDKNIYSPNQIPREDIDLNVADPSGLIWVTVNDTISPVFVVKNAKDVFEHILDWSDGKPHEWFKLYHSGIKKKKNFAYYVGLFPDIYKTWDRLKLVFKDLEKMHIAFHPISIFIEDKESYSNIVSQNVKKTSVLFIDSDAINNPDDVDVNDIQGLFYHINNIDVVDSIQDGGRWKYCKDYCKSSF